MKRIITIAALFLFSTNVFACVCKDIGKLSKTSVERYDVIFTGKVLAISGDEETQRVQFTILELFKGSAYKSIELQHNPSSDCSLSFAPGETWTIYGRWMEYDINNRRGIPTADFCTFSRLQPELASDDMQLPDRGTYAQELKFLRDSLGVQEFLDPTENKDLLHQNELPGPGTAIGYLVAGLGGLAIIFYFVRRMFKRDGK